MQEFAGHSNSRWMAVRFDSHDNELWLDLGLLTSQQAYCNHEEVLNRVVAGSHSSWLHVPWSNCFEYDDEVTTLAPDNAGSYRRRNSQILLCLPTDVLQE